MIPSSTLRKWLVLRVAPLAFAHYLIVRALFGKVGELHPLGDPWFDAVSFCAAALLVLSAIAPLLLWPRMVGGMMTVGLSLFRGTWLIDSRVDLQDSSLLGATYLMTAVMALMWVMAGDFVVLGAPTVEEDLVDPDG